MPKRNTKQELTYELIPRTPPPGNTKEQVGTRRKWIEEKVGTSLAKVGSFTTDPTRTTGNIENMIGTAQIPIGLAGPLQINGQHAKGMFYVPMATTEGALVKSYERGMVVITESGGTNVRVLKDIVHISPLFILPSLEEVMNFIDWVKKELESVKGVAEATSRHGKLVRIEPHVLNRQVILNFQFQTGDAMGLNMITVAADAACRYIKEQTGVQYLLASNFSSEKKPSYFNYICGKGKEVVAEVCVPKAIVRRFLRGTSDEIVRTSRYALSGTIRAGVLGFNGHFANGLAAMSITCGQDVASIVTSCHGTTYMESTNDGDLYASVHLPSLIIGTVGGGVGLETHRECLELLGCFGAGKVHRLAEIVAATLLAGELSLAAAFTQDVFANAHDRLGRNRPE
jgi:hydroxymethylglutaryl-CoA reductase (NADPH)